MGLLPFRTESRSGRDKDREERVPEVVLGGILAARKDLNNFSFQLVPTKIWCHE